jgi:hypothetical protein
MQTKSDGKYAVKAMRPTINLTIMSGIPMSAKLKNTAITKALALVSIGILSFAHTTWANESIKYGPVVSGGGTLRGQVDVVATTATTDTPTAHEMRGSWHTASNTAIVTYTLPEISTIGVGASACFYDLDATAILTIDVDAADVIVLNGVDLDAGDTIDSPGARGDFICLLAIDTTNWLALGSSGVWVDGGP